MFLHRSSTIFDINILLFLTLFIIINYQSFIKIISIFYPYLLIFYIEMLTLYFTCINSHIYFSIDHINFGLFSLFVFRFSKVTPFLRVEGQLVIFFFNRFCIKNLTKASSFLLIFSILQDLIKMNQLKIILSLHCKFDLFINVFQK